MKVKSILVTKEDLKDRKRKIKSFKKAINTVFRGEVSICDSKFKITKMEFDKYFIPPTIFGVMLYQPITKSFKDTLISLATEYGCELELDSTVESIEGKADIYAIKPKWSSWSSRVYSMEL